MGKFLTLISFVIIHAFGVYSQDYIIKDDGSLVQYESLKKKSEGFELKIPFQKEKLRLSSKEVFGRISFRESILYRNVPGEKEFLPQIRDGVVKAYGYSETYTFGSVQTGMYQTSRQKLVLERDGKFQNVLIMKSGFTNPGKTRESLAEIFKDYPAFTENVDNRGFKLDYDGILEIVDSHNVENHKESDANTKSKITIYRKKGIFKKGEIELLIGKNSYDLIPNSIAKSEVSPGTGTKVCLMSAAEDYCTIIQGIDKFERFFRVGMRDSKFILIPMPKQVAKKEIAEIDRSNNWSRGK